MIYKVLHSCEYHVEQHKVQFKTSTSDHLSRDVPHLTFCLNDNDFAFFCAFSLFYLVHACMQMVEEMLGNLLLEGERISISKMKGYDQAN